MIRIDYKDFFKRKTSLGKLGLRAIPESKESFIRRLEEFINQGNRKVINIETDEARVRVWFQMED